MGTRIWRRFSGNFITSPIFYVNSKPHIGHLYTAVLCDTYKRWHDLCNETSILSIGTDEHGLKVQQAATEHKASTLEFCDLNSQAFRNLFSLANIQNTDFIRTTENRHKITVQQLWNKLEEGGHIYKGYHEGWYSVSDEVFVPESQVYSENLNGIIVHKSKETGKLLEWTREENYKFRLSEFTVPLLNWLKQNPNTIVPSNYQREIINQIEDGLADLSISRVKTRVQWGISVPNDPEHVIYVWLDALANYLTVTNYPTTNIVPTLQIMGKDIIKFHGIYWPAFRMAAGLEMPKKMLVHGHWLINNQKMSKSSGNGVDPIELLDKFGVDAIRYFLVRDGGIGIDPEFTLDTVWRRYKHDLAGQLGNVIMRCSSKKINPTMVIPDQSSKLPFGEIETHLLQECATIAEKCKEKICNGNLDLYLAAVGYLVAELNKLWSTVEPWRLSKGEVDKLQNILYITFEVIRICAILYQPVMPSKMKLVLDQMNVPENQRLLEHAQLGKCTLKRVMNQSGPLFPRLD